MLSSIFVSFIHFSYFFLSNQKVGDNKDNMHKSCVYGEREGKEGAVVVVVVS